MKTSTLSAAWIALALFGAGAHVWSIEADAPIARAEVDPPYQDTDGDLLPDRLEWVLMSDPLSPDTDMDGTDDFLEAVQHQPPMGANPKALDHEMRVVISTYRDAAGADQVVLNILFRFATGSIEQVQDLEPFLLSTTSAVPLLGVLGRSTKHFEVRKHPTQGSYGIVSSELGRVESLRPLTPCAVGIRGRIGGRELISGTYLMDVDGALCAIVPVTDTKFTLQTAGGQGKAASFWRRNAMCELSLVAMGTGWRSFMVEVSRAACSGVPVLACPPDCGSQLGRILFLPFGIGILRGG